MNMAVASFTRLRPSLMPARRNSVRRCCLTVRGLMLRWLAISLLLHPWTSRRRTCWSRGVILISLRLIMVFPVCSLWFSLGVATRCQPLQAVRPLFAVREGLGDPGRERRVATGRRRGGELRHETVPKWGPEAGSQAQRALLGRAG